MTAFLVPFFCAFGAAVLSAWGVGGGTLLLLTMTLFLDVDPVLARGINSLYFLPTAALALVLHARHHCLDLPTLKQAVPAALPAALLGAWLSTTLDASLFRRPFAIFLLLSAAGLLWPQSSGRK